MLPRKIVPLFSFNTRITEKQEEYRLKKVTIRFRKLPQNSTQKVKVPTQYLAIFDCQEVVSIRRRASPDRKRRHKRVKEKRRSEHGTQRDSPPVGPLTINHDSFTIVSPTRLIVCF